MPHKEANLENTETPLFEFRQVQFMEWIGDHPVMYFKVQQKWLVAGDKKYQTDTGQPNNPNDFNVGADYDMKTYFLPTKVEWRFLPTVLSEDA